MNMPFQPYPKSKQLGKNQKDKDLPKFKSKRPKKKKKNPLKTEVYKGRTIPSKKIRGRITTAEYNEALRQHGEHCHFCGTTTNLECHHVIPKGYSRIKNGRGVWRNLRFLCSEHHRGKTGVHENKMLMEGLQVLHESLYGPYFWCDRYDLFKLGLIPTPTSECYERFMQEQGGDYDKDL
jgi:5-methylcytosine-specific restriction endonuclease McrA